METFTLPSAGDPQCVLLDAAFDDLLEQQVDEALAGRLRQAAAILKDCREEYDRTMTSIRHDLRPQAAEAATTTLQARLANRIRTATDPLLRDIQQRQVSLRVRLAPKPIDTADRTLLVIEARQRLLELDPLIRHSVLAEAARTGDEITTAAATSCPLWFRDAMGQPMGTPEVLASISKIFAERQLPDVAAMLSGMTNLAATLATMIETTRRYCHCEVDVIAEMARGEHAAA
jgi:hypothetical protein